MTFETVRLGDVVQFNPRETIKKGELAKKIDMSVLQPFTRDIPSYELLDFKGGTKFRNGDTIMARITPCLENGKTAKVNILDNNEVGFGSTEYIVFRAIEGITNEDFVYYLVCSPLIRNPAIKSMVGSSGRQRVQTDVLQNLEISIPDLETQCKIGSLLRSFDDKIELNNRINKNLEEQAQAIFKAWFVDFEPFGGVMPDDWRIGKLKEIINIKKNSIKSGTNTELPYLPIDKIPMNTFAVKEFCPNSEAKSSLITFDEDDIIIGAMRVYFHRVIIAPCSGITRTTCFVLTPYDKIYLAYALLLCNQDNSINFAQKTSKGSTMPYAIWDGGLGDMNIIIPTHKIAVEFNNIIKPILNQIKYSYFQNQHLSALRDTLLPKLMNGEIDVSEVKI